MGIFMSRVEVTQKKDKKKIIGEVFSEERLKTFLTVSEVASASPSASLSREYRILLKAYRGLPLTAFQAFVPLYHAVGHPLNPKDQHGVPIQEMMLANVSHAGYAEALANYVV